MPSDVSEIGSSAARDAQLFPSDDELTQRSIWTAFVLVSGFAIVGLAGALPLYIVRTPCTGDTAPPPQYGGGWSTLQDLSLLRVLRLLQNGNIATQSVSSPGGPASSALERRLIVNGHDYAHEARIRLLILTVLLLVVAVFPILIKLMKEFNKLLAYRHRWLAIRCDNMEMGWLSIERTPGLKGMGESDVKDLFAELGVMKRPADGTTSSMSESPRRRRPDTPTSDDEDGALTGRRGRGGNEIDVTGVFTIV
jgi:hypothetical protein